MRRDVPPTWPSSETVSWRRASSTFEDLGDRGLLKPGYIADVTIFDGAGVRDESTFDDPHRYPSGIPYVIVNGHVVVDKGRFTAARSGAGAAPHRRMTWNMAWGPKSRYE